ncbi:MAG: YggS family pyridoxal phosphate-dependent enzyme [Verrucomicrobia bacterium]|nr:YggS family pyridoxal phosphate-dependent enzyme [Verrucomicrobiota bacterium]MBV9434616.1 YggS family pyridoxal phosphate-dependent enzyme [Acidobacteriota bacterium]
MQAKISENLAKVRAAISDAERRGGRDVGSTTLVAVSKTHPADIVRLAVEASQLLFGENRVQEAKAKAPELPSKLEWHLIGHLQKNKVRQALPLFEMIHGADSIELLQDLDRIAHEMGLFPKVLLQVNLAGESSKFGFTPVQLFKEIDAFLELDRVQIEGLMTLPPIARVPEDSRRFFVQLREMREKLARELGFPLRHLSMGMSGDYEVAVEEGATLVRIGTAIFGNREPRSG